MAKVTTRDRVRDGATWLPFQMLYVEMAKRKEINSLREVREKALEYWVEVCEARQGTREHRLWIAQALYVYDLIIEKTNQ